jgi:hypothetical protein
VSNIINKQVLPTDETQLTRVNDSVDYAGSFLLFQKKEKVKKDFPDFLLFYRFLFDRTTQHRLQIQRSDKSDKTGHFLMPISRPAMSFCCFFLVIHTESDGRLQFPPFPPTPRPPSSLSFMGIE